MHGRGIGKLRRHAPACRFRQRYCGIDGLFLALRNLLDLGAFFDELARVLRTGGRVALLDVATPPNPFLRWGHGIYFGKVVPRIGALLSNGPAYRYLPKSVAYLPGPPVTAH